MEIIGREKEIEELRKLKDSKCSEFIMVYGRRRVGKTYLIREFFKGKFDFHITGIANGNKKEQLLNFRDTLRSYDSQLGEKIPENWFEAFHLLQLLLEKSKNKNKVIFFDELPWMDTAKSGFIKAIEHFWNGWAASRNDIKLIVCGSAASWMVKNIVHNHGGLHNRLTCKLRLMPFSLSETKKYLHYLGLKWSNQNIAECYMIMGGIPYYLHLLDKQLSLAQNIDRLFFSETALLSSEFENLYASLFKHSNEYVNIIDTLSKKKSGYTREELLSSLKLQDGGGFTRKLDELEQCGFIRKYKTIGGEVNSLYQLVDFYSLFYYSFIKKNKSFDNDTWMNLQKTTTYNTWKGLSFERLCLAHLQEIKNCLGISGISTNSSVFFSKEAQIDLVIERGDRTMSMCEIKCWEDDHSLQKRDADSILNKESVLKKRISKKFTIQSVLICANKIKSNDYSRDIINKIITLEDLIS